MTNEKRLEIKRHRLACEIDINERMLASGNLDEEHTDIVKATILWLQVQLARAVKK